MKVICKLSDDKTLEFEGAYSDKIIIELRKIFKEVKVIKL